MQVRTLEDLKHFNIDGYKSFADVVKDVRETAAINLKEIVLYMSKELKDTFVPEPDAIYLTNSVDPLLNFDIFDYVDENKKPVTSIEDLKKAKEIYQVFRSRTSTKEKEYRKVCTVNPLLLRNIKTSPEVSYIGINVCVAEAYRFFSQATTQRFGIHCLSEFEITLENFIKENRMTYPQYTSNLTPTELSIVDNLTYYEEERRCFMHRLNERIEAFTGDDLFSTFRLRRSNTTLFIERGLDFRVIEYYRPKFEEHERLVEELFG